MEIKSVCNIKSKQILTFPNNTCRYCQMHVKYMYM